MTIATAAPSPQSLARGAAGTALLTIEQALSGGETWTAAHQAISAAFAGEADAGPGACLLHGVPALALVLRAAQADGHRRYQAEARVLSEHLALLIGGLLLGLLSAAIAVWPDVQQTGGALPWAFLATLNLGILLFGAFVCWLAASTALRGRPLEALRRE